MQVEFKFNIEQAVHIIGTPISGKVIGLHFGQSGKLQTLVEWCNCENNIVTRYFYEDEVKAVE